MKTELATKKTNPLLQMRPFIVTSLAWETPNVFSLMLAPAEGDVPTFSAGQWVYLHLLKTDGESAGRAAFSIASSPEESKDALRFGIKLHGQFTTALSKLKPGDTVGVQGPFGVFIVKDETAPKAFFAGGIGISPLLSMIRSLASRRFAAPVALFYSNKRAEDIAYRDELLALKEAWPMFKPVFTLTEATPHVWTGESGRVNPEMIDRHFDQFDHGEFFVCGPPSFMDAVKTMLEEKGVDVKKQLKRESFG